MADVVQSANVGMRQLGDRPRFILQALPQIRVLRKVFGQDFDGDGSVESRILRSIHFAHPASRQRCDDFVGAKPGTRRKGHKWRNYSLMAAPAGIDPHSLAYTAHSPSIRMLITQL